MKCYQRVPIASSHMHSIGQIVGFATQLSLLIVLRSNLDFIVLSCV